MNVENDPPQGEAVPHHSDLPQPDDNSAVNEMAPGIEAQDKLWGGVQDSLDRPPTVLQSVSPNVAEPSGAAASMLRPHEPPQEQSGGPPASSLAAGPDTTILDRVHLFDPDNDSESFNDQPFLHDTLPEVESSFVASLSPLPAISKDGPDDTYLFDSPHKHTPPPPPSPPVLVTTTSPPARAGGISLSSQKPSQSLALDPPSQQGPSSAQIATVAANASLSSSSDAPSTNEVRRSSLRYGKRPRFLRSRNASQRSSASSFTTNVDAHDDAGSDVTVGQSTDYALQSGGAIPAIGGVGRQTRPMALSRTVSLASVASTMDHFPDSGNNSADRLAPLSETYGTTGRCSFDAGSRLSENEDLLRTPKATKATLAPPTDTVLARRVMDVQVPESLANEYKFKGGLATPRKPSDFSTAGTASTRRPGRSNLTLKEQSSTIERLSKENFDLKLKVMFLSDRLDKLSEDSVKEMIQENVAFRTNIAILQRDNKALRRRVKDFERKLKDEDGHRPGTSRSADSSNNAADADAQDREEEVLYLRKRVEDYTATIDRFRQDLLNKEAEKRHMAGMVKSLQTSATDRNAVTDDSNLGRQEEEDVWKDLLEQETARREQADEDNRRLRDEIFRLRQDFHNHGGVSGSGGSYHTNSTYNNNYSKKSTAVGNSVISRDGPDYANAEPADLDLDPSVTSGSATLVEELRRESEQLRHENAELRKEVGAQTSMLTSRNREKERLYQEIEDLKMAQRRGGGAAPSTIDSFLDHSASQVGIGGRERPGSRASGGTRAIGPETVMGVDDEEREDLENRNATLRDKINEAKLENQTLLQELELALQQKQEVEETALGVQQDYEVAMVDLMAMQAERDDLLAELNDLEQKHGTLQAEFDDLRAEAQEAVDGYEDEADVREEELAKLQTDLAERTENFTALQDEMRKLSEALVGLEDETENKVRRIQQLEQELGEANKELEELEAKLLEANDKSQRLLVQQENSQGEISFLREEQESDKIAISRLEANLSKAEESLRDEQERIKQLQQQIVAERERSESLATKDKKDMQHVVNELSRDASAAKEEARKLRKSLTSREVEATEWKERLLELESNLREALGDLSGTRSGLLKAIAMLQRKLEDTVRELDTTKDALMEKDRLLKQRDALLESHGLEARKTAEALDKERVAHRHTKHQFETFQKTHQHVTRTMTTQDARISELELNKNQDKKRLSQLEATFKDQLHERNNLLLLLWTRLSAVCGVDWAHDNSLVSGRALPSLEVVATMLPGFTRNLMAAIKHIEAAVGGFPARIKAVEKDLWREYQNLETSLDARVKKLDRLEAVVRNGLATGSLGALGALGSSGLELQNRLLRVEEAYRQLKVENATLRTANEVRARAAYSNSMGGGGGDALGMDLNAALSAGSPSPSIPTGPRDRSRTGTLRSKSSSSRGGIPRPSTAHSSRTLTAGELALQDAGAGSGSSNGGSGVDFLASTSSGGGGGDSYNADPRWILRLRDLENKLKLEREGRTMDRNEAARRLREQEAELKWRNEREMKRSAS